MDPVTSALIITFFIGMLVLESREDSFMNRRYAAWMACQEERYLREDAAERASEKADAERIRRNRETAAKWRETVNATWASGARPTGLSGFIGDNRNNVRGLKHAAVGHRIAKVRCNPGTKHIGNSSRVQLKKRG